MLLLVEYNVDKGNPWVPFPLSFRTFKSAGAGGGLLRAAPVGNAPVQLPAGVLLGQRTRRLSARPVRAPGDHVRAIPDFRHLTPSSRPSEYLSQI